MSEHFKVITSGDAEMRRTLGDLVRVARRPKLAMQNVAAVLEDETDKNFMEQGRPTKWEKLAEATQFKRIGGAKGLTKKGLELKRSERVLAEMKTKKGLLRERSKRLLDQMQILQDSGVLADSIHSRHGDDWALVGSGTPYARIHQLGGTAGVNRSVTIPARPFLPFTPDFKIQQGTDKAIVDAAIAAIKSEITK